MIKVEIACNNLNACVNAVHGGANRIELFENLADGGCTPSAGMIKKVNELDIPCYVMIRPRGGDFCYSNDEVDIMLQDIEACKAVKVAGIVFGCLTRAGEVDTFLNKKLLSAWNHGPATFHRAIDRSNDMIKASRTVLDIGFERILSSGGAPHVNEGLEVLKKMQVDVGRQIIIMPGAGVTAKNIKHILDFTGCSEIHATCKQTITLKTGQFNESYQESGLNEISLLVNSVRNAGV